MKKFYMERNVLLYISKDGVITYRAKGPEGRWPAQPMEEGLAFYSVHEVEHAKDLQVFLCKLQYERNPDGSPCYKLHPFDGDFESIEKASDLFHNSYMKLLDRYQQEEQRRRDEQETTR